MVSDPNRPTVDAKPMRQVAQAEAETSSAWRSPFDLERDRFAEGAELGRGGMGRVYEAHDRALDRPVAIKQALATDDEMGLRFEREVRITARLQHPGIVPILDAGRDDHGRPFYVMRKIEGRPLATLIDEARTARDRLALVTNVLAAVDACAYAHARGVIHRDIKPWNVLVGEFGETLLIDWGIAREIDDETPDAGGVSSGGVLTQIGSACGTPGFMAPEQARGETADRRADVYALGATLYHVLVGERPHANLDATRIIELVGKGAELDLDKIPDEVPAALSAIVAKATASAPGDRYPTAGELAADLRRFLTGQLVAAHRYTKLELVLRWLRRHKIAVAIAAVAIAAIATTSTIAIRSVIDERDRAQAATAIAIARADERLVERADAIATSDPARSLALLKLLPRDSASWGRAVAVAETARAFGPGRGAAVAIKTLPRLVGSNNRLALLADDTVYLVDPTLRKPPTKLANVPLVPGNGGAWSGDLLFVYSSTTELAAIDARDGSIKRFAIGAAIDEVIGPASDGRIFVLANGRLLEVDVAGGPPRDVHEARVAIRIERASVVSAASGVWVVPDEGRPIQIHASAADELRNLEGTPRVAARTQTEVIEWTVQPSGAEERGRWSVTPTRLHYAGNSLAAIKADGVTWLDANKPPRYDTQNALFATVETVTITLLAAPDAVYVSAPGSLRRYSEGTAVEIGGRPDGFASLGYVDHHLVGVTPGGLLRSWNLRELLPRRIASPNGGRPRALANEMVWFARIDTPHLSGIELATGKAHDLPGRSYVCGALDRTIVRGRDDEGDIVFEAYDRKTREPVKLVGVTGQVLALCSPNAHALVLAGGRRFEVISTTAGHARSLATIEAPTIISLIVASDRWLVWGEAGVAIHRLNLATKQQTTLPVLELERLAIDDHGRVAFTHEGKVYVWPPGATAAHVVLESPTKIAVLVANPAGIVAVTIDHAIIVIDEHDRTRTYQAGRRINPVPSLATPLAMIADLDQNTAVLDLRDGAVRRTPWWTSLATLGPDGSTVLGEMRGEALVWASAVPSEPAAIRAWLDDATNAVLDSSSTAVRWK